jgi:hypothetical protein
MVYVKGECVRVGRWDQLVDKTINDLSEKVMS